MQHCCSIKREREIEREREEREEREREREQASSIAAAASGEKLIKEFANPKIQNIHVENSLD
jgi:hypothetical protein